MSGGASLVCFGNTFFSVSCHCVVNFFIAHPRYFRSTNYMKRNAYQCGLRYVYGRDIFLQVCICNSFVPHIF
jgi:hypothetical protein